MRLFKVMLLYDLKVLHFNKEMSLPLQNDANDAYRSFVAMSESTLSTALFHNFQINQEKPCDQHLCQCCWVHLFKGMLLSDFTVMHSNKEMSLSLHIDAYRFFVVTSNATF